MGFKTRTIYKLLMKRKTWRTALIPPIPLPFNFPGDSEVIEEHN